MRQIGIYIFSLLFVIQLAYAQEEDYDALLDYYLESDSILLNELELQLASDSLDIFDLMDSLLLSDYRYSQLSIRMGYTSDITYAGRNFGFNQYGLNGGLAYYHKSGLFADLSGYWNSSLDPSYNPTITTLGYLGNFTHKWTYTLSYDHFFYREPKEEDSQVYFPLTNSINASTYYDIGKFTAATDYSFMLGDETAHRLRFNILYNISKNNWGFIDRFVFMPSASILLGNATIYQINPVYQELNLGTRYEIRQLMYDEYGDTLIKYLWRNKREEYLKLEKAVYENNQDQFVTYEYEQDNQFGIMNYSFSAPFYFYIDNFTLALSYIYNIPVPLPGEDLQLDNNSYIGASLIYNIPLKKKKK